MRSGLWSELVAVCTAVRPIEFTGALRGDERYALTCYGCTSTNRTICMNVRAVFPCLNAIIARARAYRLHRQVAKDTVLPTFLEVPHPKRDTVEDVICKE